MRAPTMTPKLAFFGLGVAFALTGCPQEKKPVEKAGEKIEDAADKAGDKLDGAADKAGDKIEEAGDAIEDKVD